jgi:hypothetical protein
MTASLSASSPRDRAVPVVDHGEREVRALYLLLTIVTIAVVLAVVIWGLPALVLTALVLVPVMFVLFVFLSLP